MKAGRVVVVIHSLGLIVCGLCVAIIAAVCSSCTSVPHKDDLIHVASENGKFEVTAIADYNWNGPTPGTTVILTDKRTGAQHPKCYIFRGGEWSRLFLRLNQPYPSIPEFDAATSGIVIDRTRLSEAEERMLAIQVPEIVFRQANIFDMLLFLDQCIPKFGKGPEKSDGSRIRIVWDSGLPEALSPVDAFGNETYSEIRYEPYLPPPYKRIPLLYSLKMLVEASHLQYTVSNLTVTVGLKTNTA